MFELYAQMKIVEARLAILELTLALEILEGRNNA
jgi:hypothetical protein